MAAEKDHLLSSLSIAVNDTTGTELSLFLFRFRREITAAQFLRVPEPNLPDTFRDVWQFLLTTAGHSSSTVRLASHRATGSFLTRIMPHFPELMLLTFGDVASLTKFDPKSSAVIASSFAFLSSFVARPFLPRSLNTMAIVEHFASPDPTFAESLPGIISKLGHLGADWLKHLLRNCLRAVEDASSRFVLKAIAAIIGHDPAVFMSEVLDFIDDRIPDNLALLAFLICTYEASIRGLDLFRVARVSCETLGSDRSTPSALDSSLQLLSVKSPSFNVAVGEMADGRIPFKVWNEVGDSVNALLEFEKVTGRPSIFMVALPVPLLLPSADDSAGVLATKLKKLATEPSLSAVELFAIFKPFLLQKYSEIVSAATQGIALCVNKLMTVEEIAPVLRQVLFCDATSWHHCDDILRVIKTLDTRLFVYVMGNSGFEELVSLLVKFIFGSNEDLSRESMTVLWSFVDASNVELILSVLIEATNFFGASDLGRALRAITEILSRIGGRDVAALQLFVQRLLEVFDLYIDDLGLLARIFGFFTIYGGDVGPLIPLAKSIIFVSITTVSGKTPRWRIKPGDDITESVNDDLLMRNVDVLMSSSSDYLAFLHPMRAALRFLFSLGTDCTRVARKSFKYFPRECSAYFIRAWPDLPNPLKSKLLLGMPQTLRYTGDDDVHAQWCRFFMESRHPDADAAIDFLTQMASGLLLVPRYADVALNTTLAAFLMTRTPSPVLTFVRNMRQSQRNSFLSASPPVRAFLKENEPSLLDGFVETEAQDAKPLMYPTLPELPKQDDEIQTAFDSYVRYGAADLACQVLRLAADRQKSLAIDPAVFPRRIVPPIAAILAKTQPHTFPVTTALDLVRTPWRSHALSCLQTHSSELLSCIERLDRVPKKSLLSVCSILGVVPIDLDALLRTALAQFHASDSPHRFCATLAFLTAILGRMQGLTGTFLEEVVVKVKEEFQEMAPSLLSRLFVAISAAVSPLTEGFVGLIQTCLPFCGTKTMAAGRCHLALLSCGVTAGKQYWQSLSETILPYLKTVLPSLYLAGLRMLEQAAVSGPWERLVIGLRPPMDVVADRYIRMSNLPDCLRCQARAIGALLRRNDIGPLHLALYKGLPVKFIIPAGCPAYFDGLLLWSVVSKVIGVEAECYQRLCQFNNALVQSQLGFEAGLEWFRQRLMRTGRAREGLYREALKNWVGKFSVPNWNYQTLQRVVMWIDVAMAIDQNWLGFAVPELTKIRPFGPVFVAIARLFVTNKGNEVLIKAMKKAEAALKVRCHRTAMQLIGKCNDWKKLVVLASFDEDCKDADKLIDELKS